MTVWVLIVFLRSNLSGGNRLPITIDFKSSQECHRGFKEINRHFGANDVEQQYFCLEKTKL